MRGGCLTHERDEIFDARGNRNRLRHDPVDAGAFSVRSANARVQVQHAPNLTPANPYVKLRFL